MKGANETRVQSLIIQMIVLCLSLIVLDSGACWAAEQTPVGGVIQGRFVWMDNTPVANCRVKLVDKIDISKPAPMVQNIAISRDAQVREIDVDAEGRFRFTNLPAGKYYFFFKSPDIFEGPEWVYRYTDDPSPHAHVLGFMHKPDEYNVVEGVITNIPDIELVRLIVPDNPLAIPDKNGVFYFQWPKHNSGKFSRITIKHQDYTGPLKHLLYGSHEVTGNTYQIPNDNPLYPGKHSFRVEIMTPTLRVFAKSKEMYFVVPGEVLFLRVNEDKLDHSRRTINWFGSDSIKSVRISTDDGSFNMTTSEHSVKLPPVTASRHLNFYALDAVGNELIPGWMVFFWQSETKSNKK